MKQKKDIKQDLILIMNQMKGIKNFKVSELEVFQITFTH